MQDTRGKTQGAANPGARLALMLVAAGLAAHLAYDLLMTRLGYGYPFNTFLFRADDRWADFFKLVFTYPGADLQPPSRAWGIQPLVEMLRQQAEAYRGTVINPDHLPPLSTLLAVMVRKAFSLLDPVLVFMACAGLALMGLASALASFATGQADRLRWIGVGLLSYPFWFMADRGHFFSLICAIATILAVRRMVRDGRMDLRTILLLAIACNLRPNIVIVPAMLVLSGRSGRFRDLVLLGAVGAGVLAASMAAAHWLYPHYGLQTWLAGLKDYNTNYLARESMQGFVSSLPSMFKLLFGPSANWQLVGLALAGVCGVGALRAARLGALSDGQLLFVTLGLMNIAIPGYSDYYLLPFVLPVMLVAGQQGAVTRGDRIAFFASIALLVPKNYLWVRHDMWDALSYQMILNPLIVVGAVAAILWPTLAFRKGEQAVPKAA